MADIIFVYVYIYRKTSLKADREVGGGHFKHTLASLKTPAKHRENKGPETNEDGGTTGPKQKDTRSKVTSDHTQDAPEHFR